ncbi:hypothetical protein [Fibrella arboris]|uniref:hypothetical protein n=1 Tax=Fibrella arboris TaxID=3242486 RepID=UPI00352109D1
MSSQEIVPFAWQRYAGQIFAGASAESKFSAGFQPWAIAQLKEKHGISSHDSGELAERAHNAAIASLRKGNHKKPDLLDQLLADQVLVYRLHQNQPPAQWLNRFRAAGERYLSRHMSRHPSGLGLDDDQEQVRQYALDVFVDELLDPRFLLTSSLDAYFIGILRRVMLEGIRSRKRTKAHRIQLPRRRRETASTLPPKPLIPAHIVRFYQRSHQVITQALEAMSDVCQRIIVHQYGLDVSRLRVVAQRADAIQPLTEDAFMARFDVAIRQPGSIGSLAQLAATITYKDKPLSEKKIGLRHRICLAQLVVTVAPQLAADPDLQNYTAVLKLLDKQLADARQRLDKRRLWR